MRARERGMQGVLFSGECVYLDAQKHPRRALQRHSHLLDQREGKMKRRFFRKKGKEGCKAEIGRSEDDGAGGVKSQVVIFLKCVIGK